LAVSAVKKKVDQHIGAGHGLVSMARRQIRSFPQWPRGFGSNSHGEAEPSQSDATGPERAGSQDGDDALARQLFRQGRPT